MLPQWLRSLPAEEAAQLYLPLAREFRRAFAATRNELSERKPELIIHLGDVTYGTDRGGLNHSSLLKESRLCIQSLRDIGTTVRVTIGNHDTGPATDENLLFGESLSHCENTFGPLFWSEIVEGVLHIGLAAPLLDYSGADSGILSRKDDQLTFLLALLRANSLPWVLYVHSPFSLRAIAPSLAPFLPRLRAVVCGHLHRPITGGFLRILEGPVASSPAYGTILRNVTICPSVAPLWSPGYNLLHLSMGGQRMHRTHQRVAKPDSSESIPKASLARCLWAFMTIGIEATVGVG